MYLAANYTVVLLSLQQLMIENNLNAYIVPAGDAHYTEFIANCHQRRAFISGFTGSAGTAIVTRDAALLWTDGRYFLQAENQLDPKLWTLMKEGQPGVLSQSAWLKQNLTSGNKVGVDPTLYSKRQWDSMEQDLAAAGIQLIAVDENLVDKVWATDGSRPPCASAEIFALDIKFAGKNTSDKLIDVRKEMEENSAYSLIVSELDEVAWLLNLRGKDIPYSATFFAYIIVTQKDFHVYINQSQLSPDAQSILKSNIPEIQLLPYSDVIMGLNQTLAANQTSKCWCNQNTNSAIVRVIPADMQLVKLTPIAVMKATKNPIEVAGYKSALIRDAAALCQFFSWLEDEMNSGKTVTEVSAAEQLHNFRKERQNFFDDSFPTISAAGANGAIIHYMPTPETDTKINRTDMFLLDSGALYYDGTTDITRTIHLGIPTPHQKNCYTRVLKGHMALARANFPNRMVGQRLDSFARQFLWEAGLDYNHGTGHGVGSFLNVHEGPFSIGSGYSSVDPGLQENFFTSNEPGYYEDNAFGIRLENLVRVQNVSLKHNFQDRGFLGFEDVTFVPYDHKLIDFSLITEEELKYLNNYQEKTRTLVGGYMKANNMSDEAYQWMLRATMPLSETGPVTTPIPSSSSIPPTSISTTAPTASSSDPSSTTTDASSANPSSSTPGTESTSSTENTTGSSGTSINQFGIMGFLTLVVTSILFN